MAKTTEKQAQTEQGTQSVEVVVEIDGHIHEGKRCKQGDKIAVTPEQAEWLREQWAILKKSGGK